MRINKIILVADPFADEPEASAEKVSRWVQGLIQPRETLVEAVYVMTPKGVGMPLEMFPEHLDYYKKTATDRLKEMLSDFKGIAETKITILPQGSNSVRSAVESLLRHVEDNGADLIALSTHARKGVDRLFLGSFAETLLLSTETPVLLANPKAPWEPKFHHILFPTDFSDGSNIAFDAAIGFAKQFGARLTLFHRQEPENFLIPPPGFIAAHGGRAREIERQTQTLRLKDRAERDGVTVEVDIDMKNHRVVPSILAAASRLKVSLIMMGTRKSSRALAIGSIPRQIVREALCPVLIYPQSNKHKSRSPHDEA